MNDHDRDLILALTEGSLSEDEAEAALLRVSADPELAAEYELQKSVRTQLETVPHAAMTASERTTLREHLTSELNLESAPIVTPVPAKRRVPWWQPVFGLAAAAVFVTAVVILPGQLGGSDDSADEVALTADPPDTTVADTSVADTLAAAGGESAEEEATSDAPPASDLPELDDADGEELLTLARGKATPDEVEQSVDAQSVAPRSAVDTSELESCLESLADELPTGDLIPIGTDEQLVFLGVDTGVGIEAVVTVNLSSCTISDIDG